MIRMRLTQKLWYYGLMWISETLSLTHVTAGRGTYVGHISLNQLTGQTSNILEYLDFGFYDQVWFKNNSGTSLFELV